MQLPGTLAALIGRDVLSQIGAVLLLLFSYGHWQAVAQPTINLAFQQTCVG